MRLVEIYIERFGQERHLHLPPPLFNTPCTVIFGPNEAGKSTLHAFIRFILFGYSGRGAHPYQPWDGDRMGGRITWLGEEGERIQLARYTPPKKGRLTLRVDGERRAEQELHHLLGQVSPALFESVFTFNHQELSRLDSLEKEEISSFLYSAAQGIGGMDLFQLEQYLIKKRDEWFRPRATKPELNQLLAQLIQEEKELAQWKRKMTAYSHLVVKLKKQSQHLDQLKAERERLERKQKELAVFIGALKLRDEISQLNDQLKPYSPSPLLFYERQLFELRLNRELVRSKRDQLARLEIEVEEKEHRLKEKLLKLGPDWKLEQIIQLDLSLPVQDRWQALRDRIKILDQEERELARRLGDEEERLKQLEGIFTREKERTREQDQVQEGEGGLPVKGQGSPRIGLPLLAGALLSLISWLVTDSPATALWTLSGWVIILILGYKMYRESQARLGAMTENQKALFTQSNQYLMQLEREIAGVKEKLALVKEKGRRLKQEKEKENERWKCLFHQLGWAHVPTVDQAASLFTLLAEVQKEQQELDRLKEQISRLSKDVSCWTAQVVRLAREITPEEGQINPDVWIDRMAERIDQARKEREEKEKLETARKQKEEQFEQAAKELGITVKQLDRRLQEVTAAQLEGERVKLAQALEENLHQIEIQATQLGEWQREQRELEQEETLTRKVQRFEEQKARFNRLAKEWAVYTLAAHLCREARHRYEEEHQPAVLQEASRFFQQMTLGRYRRVISPLGQQELFVLRQDGERYPAPLLSQGTKEQLYLSLRFAFIKELARRVKLPVVMDDPLINCDRERLNGILKGLKGLSETHQIILFTCHHHILEAVQKTWSEGEVSLVHLGENMLQS